MRSDTQDGGLSATAHRILADVAELNCYLDRLLHRSHGTVDRIAAAVKHRRVGVSFFLRGHTHNATRRRAPRGVDMFVCGLSLSLVPALLF